MGCSSSKKKAAKAAKAAGSANSSGSSEPLVKTVHASGFDQHTNFKFAYDPGTAVINVCYPGGLAEQNGLLNWAVQSFKLPAQLNQIQTESGTLTDGELCNIAKKVLGKLTLFQIGNEEHSRLLREIRPLTVTFEKTSIHAVAGREVQPTQFGVQPYTQFGVEPTQFGGQSAEQAQLEAALVASQEEFAMEQAMAASVRDQHTREL